MLQRKPKYNWDVNVADTAISKLVKTEPNCKYLIGIKFDKAIRPLVLMIPKMSWYSMTFNVKKENNKLMSSCINHGKLLENKKQFGMRRKI